MSLIELTTRNDVKFTHKFPYHLDDFQMNGCWGIETNKNVLITAHTSSGKTAIAEYAIALAVHLKKKVIYTSPIKTLSNQKFFDFKKTFANCEIGILTGDIKLNPEADILIMTTEILRNKLDYEQDSFADIHSVIFDEVHYFNDPERGFIWEECITKLPKHILLVMLSATIDKANEFGEWVARCRERDTLLIGTTWRPVPLHHYIYTNNEIKLIRHHRDGVFAKNIDECYCYYDKQSITTNRLISLTEFLRKKELFPSICFSFSRKKCFEYCLMMKRINSLLTPEETKEMRLIVHKIFSTNLAYYRDIPSTLQLLEMLEYGASIHHSGLLPIQKELIEVLFSRGLIKFLFATETFAVGVNMPTRSVIFTELSKHDGKGTRILRYDEFMQMSGRAGRRGKDPEGYVIYCPLRPIEPKHEIMSLLKGKSLKLVSQYNESANTFLRLLNTTTYDEIGAFYKKTLYGLEQTMGVAYYEREHAELEEALRMIPDVELTADEKEVVRLYMKIKPEIENSRGNARQKLQKQFDEISGKMNQATSDYIQNDLHRKHLMVEMKKVDENIEYSQNAIEINLEKIRDFNVELELITETPLITPYGKIVASLSNCCEVVLGKLIQDRFFDGLDWKTVGVVFACFSEDSPDGEDDVWDKTRAQLDEGTILALDSVWYTYGNIMETYYKYEMEHRLNISFGFVIPFIRWIEKEPLIEVLRVYNNFDGNFVKSIFKIRDICNEVLKVCVNFNLGELQEKINVLLENLIYGIGCFNSLYIHHYELIEKL
jgi:superfamily II RNA helicase